MIARLLGALTTAGVYLGAATLLAQLIIVTHLCIAWNIDRDRLARIIAVARGIDVPRATAASQVEDQRGTVQASYQALLDRRAAASKDLEVREMELRSAKDQYLYEDSVLTKKQAEFQQRVDSFNARLLSLSEGTRADGLRKARQILETSMKPDQAKEMLLDMLDNDETEEVVLLLRDMSDRPRSKIMAELNDIVGNEELTEVLRLIRLGEPEASIVAEASQNQAGTPR